MLTGVQRGWHHHGHKVIANPCQLAAVQRFILQKLRIHSIYADGLTCSQRESSKTSSFCPPVPHLYIEFSSCLQHLGRSQ